VSRSCEGAIVPIIDWCVSKMAMHNDDRRIGDKDSLTVMSKDILIELSSPNDARYQRDVSWIREVFEQRTNRSKQFWNLRYDVQKSSLPFTNKHRRISLLGSRHCIT
jgi:hypothetical protein